MSRLQRLEEQIEQVDADLAAVDSDEAAGDLDAATAEELRATYRSERMRLARELDTAAADQDIGPNRRRVAWGVGVSVAALVAVGWFMSTVIDDRAPGELATGGIAGEVASGGVDLASVSNEEMEAVIAENPDIVGMRAALARRYFSEGEFSAALGHYLIVLEQDPGNAEALANVGWMSYLSDEAELAEAYVTRALDAAPGYPEALWYLANIRLFGVADPQGAVEPLEQLLAVDGLPDEVQAEAQSLLEMAQSG